MSQSTAARSPARAPGARPVPPRPAQGAPRLRVVSAPRDTRSRAGLVVVCVGLLVLGLVGLLLLNVSLEHGTYDLRDQASRAAQLREQRQHLQEELRAAQSPEHLYEKARGGGMVDGPDSWLYLQGGRTLGAATPAPKPTSSTVTAETSQPATNQQPTVNSGTATPRR